jgi:hypothetical protein
MGYYLHMDTRLLILNLVACTETSAKEAIDQVEHSSFSQAAFSSRYHQQIRLINSN